MIISTYWVHKAFTDKQLYLQRECLRANTTDPIKFKTKLTPKKLEMTAVTSIQKQTLDAPFKAQFSRTELDRKYGSPMESLHTRGGKPILDPMHLKRWDPKKEKIGRNKGEQNWGQKKEELH